MTPNVAALYIDPLGPYPRIPGVECWGLPERDARTYAGPHSIVVHPPCGPWGRLRHLCRYQDPSCGPRGVEQVRAFGGVLEHPAGSRLWPACDMPTPWSARDAFGGYTIELTQVSWGHVARKRTWLYIVGVPLDVVRAGYREGGTPTHWISGKHFTDARGTTPMPPGIKACSAELRRRTPIAFAEWLVSLARAVVS